jgi:UDP-N-acetylglucosamine 3-dehydrogenase
MRLIVVGGGMMGANHVRVARRTAGVELVGLVEPDAERRASVAAGDTEFRQFDTVEDALAGVDFDSAVVASPTPTHHANAGTLIDAGKHVLIEKPIAATTEQAADLVARAEAAGVVLTVGHVERFNAAYQELRRNLTNPIHLEMNRSSPFSARIRDSVVIDLMIHDLDLASDIAGCAADACRSVEHSTRSNVPDLCSALVTFESGLTATITASRIGQQKVRSITVTEDDCVITADLLKQEVLIHRVQHVEFVGDDGVRYRQTGTIEVPFIENRGEPLMQELAAFTRSVVHGEPVVVTGTEAIRAMLLCDYVRKSRVPGR